MTRHMKLLSRVVFLCLVFALMAGFGGAAQARAAANIPASANQAVVEKYFGTLLSTGDAATADAILAPNFQRIDRSQSGAKLGSPGIKFLAEYHRRAMPDLRYTIDDLLLDGDHVAVCWTAKGTQTGDYGAAPASDEPVVWTGMSFIELSGGKIVGEETNLEDLSEVLHTQGLRISPSYIQ